MAYLIFFAVIAILLLFVFVRGAADEKKNKKKFLERLDEGYGKRPGREYTVERFARIDSYYKKHPKQGQIDDITWNDLDMDNVFKRMNYTLSSTGEEYLYYTLRTPKYSAKDKNEFDELEELTGYFSADPKMRLSVQSLLGELGTMGKYSLYDYLDFLDDAGQKSNFRHIAADLLLIVFIAVCFVNLTLGLAGIIVLICYQIISYFGRKREIDPFISSFSYILRLVHVSDELTKLEIPVCRSFWEEMREQKDNFGKMKRGSVLVMWGGDNRSGGNPFKLIMDYVNMILHLDIIVFNHMIGELDRHVSDVDALAGKVGMIETSICIGEYRTSLGDGEWCRPEFISESGKYTVTVIKGYHPLIEKPVKNNIDTDRSVLLTGSNASGKSTFLKMVAVNAILAQTINTCCAERFRAPRFRVVTSMAISDNIENGESYYVSEIKSMKRILDLKVKSDIPILCFVDEVLRGTNTVERIAASAQILKSLSGCDILCFAATHDTELTEMLEGVYANYHFEEEIRDGDIVFNYILKSGRANSRNAIRLLEIMGYDEDIVRAAEDSAGHFIQTGEWV